MQRQKFNTLGGLNIQSTWCLECDSYMKSAMLSNPFSFVPITTMNTVDLPPTRLLLIGLAHGTVCNQSIINRAAMRTNKKEQRNVRIQKVQLHREFLQ